VIKKNNFKLIIISIMILGVLLLLLLNGCSLFRQYGSLEGYVYVPDTGNKGAIIIRDSNQVPTGYKPLPGAKVSAQDFYNFVFTDIYGYFLLEDIVAGPVNILIEPPVNSGYNALTTQAIIEPDTTIPIGTYGAVSLPSENADHWDVTINKIDTTNWPEVKVYVQVIDPINNSPIIGANDFEVDINGYEIGSLTVQSAGASASSSSSSLVIDRSGSMSGTELSDAKDAAKTFVGFMTANDRAEVVSFASSVTVDQSFTNDKSALYNAIDNLYGTGWTALYDGIWKGLDDTALESNERKALIALTDGQENWSSTEHGGGSPPDTSLVINHAQGLNIPVYTIGLGLSKGFTVEEGVRISRSFDPIQDLQQIADDTGGEFFDAPTSSDLEHIYVQITQRMQQQYIITFTDNTGVTEGYLTVKLNYNQLYGDDTKEYNPPTTEVISDSRDRAAAALRAVEEFNGLFTLPDNFPKSLVLAIIARETGRNFEFNNELISFDWGRGLMQITTDDFVGAGSGGCDSDYCWDCRGKNEEACYSYYSNNQEGINRNVRDGYYALAEKFSITGYCANCTGYENNTIITPEEICWISTVQQYNTGYSEHPTEYVYHIGNILKNYLSWNWYYAEGVENDPGLGNKFIEAYNNKEEIILCSSAHLRVYDSQGRAAGLIKGEVAQEIPNLIYDPNSIYDTEREIVIIFFPIDSYRYEVVGKEKGTYSLTINSAKEGDISGFEAIDIPISDGAIHQYTIDWEMLSQSQEGVTVQMDSDGDGTPELTITTDSTFTFPPGL